MLPSMWLCLVFAVTVGAALVPPCASIGCKRQPMPLLCRAPTANIAVLGSALLLAQETAVGEQIFVANCAACHAQGGNAVVHDRTLEREAIAKYLLGGFTEKAITYQVTHGKNAMPAFEGRLSAQDISDVAAHVLRTAEEGWH